MYCDFKFWVIYAAFNCDEIKILHGRLRLALLDIKICCKCPQCIHLLTTERGIDK